MRYLLMHGLLAASLVTRFAAGGDAPAPTVAEPSPPARVTSESAGSAVSPSSPVSASQAAIDWSRTLQTGALLFSQGDCLAIRVYTASPYTHVAIVCREEGEPVVYDSMNGVGVRRLALADYFASECPNQVHLFQPRRPLTAEQERMLSTYLQSQVGRPYAIAHHLTGDRVAGLHCAEYATDALMAISLMQAHHPARVSPASLATGITQSGVYDLIARVDLIANVPPAEQGSNRCHQLWLDTKRCTFACCEQLQGWILCR